MVEKFLALFERLVIAFESIAVSMKDGGKTRGGKGGKDDTPVAPTAPVAPPSAAPVMPAAIPAAATQPIVPTAPAFDDLGLPAAKAAPTKDEFNSNLVAIAQSKGRDAVRAAMKTFGYESAQDIKAEHYQPILDKLK